MSVFLLTTCSQPFDFQIDKISLVVIDAKISNIPGASFVYIYTQADSSEIVLPSYRVGVESGSEMIEFTYDAESENYVPNDSQFAGLPGEQYRLIAVNEAGQSIISDYDIVPEPVDFELSVRDTTILVQNDLNLARRGARVASVDLVTQETISRFSFTLLYLDHWSKDTSYSSNTNEFVLLDHRGSMGSEIGIDVSVLPVRDFWVFQNVDLCGPSRDPAGCFLPCCITFPEWPVWFQISHETISVAAYEYWSEVERLTRGDGLVFDSYPFPLKGNIRCEECDGEVVGFFRAVSENSGMKATTL